MSEINEGIFDDREIVKSLRFATFDLRNHQPQNISPY
jgi:hypothetical protein